MGSGNFTLTWGKFPRGVISAVVGILLLWFTTYVDLWSKLNWYGQLLVIAGITFIFLQPSITLKESEKLKINKGDCE